MIKFQISDKQIKLIKEKTNMDLKQYTDANQLVKEYERDNIRKQIKGHIQYYYEHPELPYDEFYDKLESLKNKLKRTF